MISSHLINIYCGKSLKFHSCLSFVRKLLIKFLKFCRNILCQRSSSLFASSELPSCILLNFLWCNKDILIEKKPIIFWYFSDKDRNFVYQLFDNNGNVKSADNVFLLLTIYYSQITILLKNALLGIGKLNSRQLRDLSKQFWCLVGSTKNSIFKLSFQTQPS